MVIAIVGGIVIIFLLIVLYGNSLFPKSSREIIQKHESVKKYADTKVLEWDRLSDTKWAGKSKLSGKILFIIEKQPFMDEYVYKLLYNGRCVGRFLVVIKQPGKRKSL